MILHGVASPEFGFILCASAPARTGEVQTLNPDPEPRNESREPGTLISINEFWRVKQGGDEEIQVSVSLVGDEVPNRAKTWNI